MTLTRAFLLFQGIGFGLFGIYMFLNPQVSMEMLGAPSMSNMGLYEMRGIYGGVSIGAAILFLSGFFKADMQRPALYFVLAYTGGYILARAAAIPLDGMPTGKMPFFIGFEFVSALIAMFLLRRKA